MGLAFAALTAVMLPISNAGMNPARPPPRCISPEVGPLSNYGCSGWRRCLAALIAGLLYRSAEMAPGARRKTDDGGAPVGSAAAPVEGATAGTAGRSDVRDVAVEGQSDEPAPADDQGAAEARDLL